MAEELTEEERAAKEAEEQAQAQAAAAAAAAAVVPLATHLRPRIFVLEGEGSGYEVGAAIAPRSLCRSGRPARHRPAVCHRVAAPISPLWTGRRHQPILPFFTASSSSPQILSEVEFQRLLSFKSKDPKSTVVRQYPFGATGLFGVPGSLEYHLMTKLSLKTEGCLDPIKIPSAAKAVASDAPLAVPALAMPSRVLFPGREILDHFFLPRVAASTQAARGARTEDVVVHRHVLEQPVVTEEHIDKVEKALESFLAWRAGEEGVGPATYVRKDLRTKEVIRKQREIAIKVAAEREASVTDEFLFGDNRRALEAEAAAKEEAERREAERRAGLKVKTPWAPRTQPFDGTPRRPIIGATLPYFATEEGIRATESNPMLQSSMARTMGRTLPPALSAEETREVQMRVRPELDAEQTATAAGMEADEAVHVEAPGELERELSLNGLDAEGEEQPAPVASHSSEDPIPDLQASLESLHMAQMRTAGGQSLAASTAAAAGQTENLRSKKFNVTGGVRSQPPPMPKNMDMVGGSSRCLFVSWLRLVVGRS